MYRNPWQPGATDLPGLQGRATDSSQAGHCLSRFGERVFDGGLHSMPPPPLPRTSGFINMQSLSHPFPDMHSLSSRSTSGASASTAQSIDTPCTMNKIHSPHAMEFRLPDDQLQQIIEALSSPAMPKRPINETGKESKVQTTSCAEIVSISSMKTSGFQYGVAHKSAAAKTHHPRECSDISMHSSCTEFPYCTSDDPSGHGIVHCSSDNVTVPTPELVIESSSLTDTTEIELDFKPLVQAKTTEKYCDGDAGSLSDSKKKRSRSALGSLDPNTTGESPQRKLSKGRSGLFVTAAKENEDMEL